MAAPGTGAVTQSPGGKDHEDSESRRHGLTCPRDGDTTSRRHSGGIPVLEIEIQSHSPRDGDTESEWYICPRDEETREKRSLTTSDHTAVCSTRYQRVNTAALQQDINIFIINQETTMLQETTTITQTRNWSNIALEPSPHPFRAGISRGNVDCSE